MLGTVHTGLLQNSKAMSLDDVAKVLHLVEGELVRHSQRPIEYAVSPRRLTGVDCNLATPSGARVRAIGTVSSNVSITGGHVLQGSAYATVAPGRRDRQPWSHYLARPGQLMVSHTVTPMDLVEGYIAVRDGRRTLDLSSIADHAMDAAQRSELLDLRSAFKGRRIRLRWAAWSADDTGAAATGVFSIRSDHSRTLALRVPDVPVESVAELCRDLALHDWLLTTLLRHLDSWILAGGSPGAVAARMRPAVDHLLHLWMPAARVAEPLMPVWDAFERRPGFTRQWHAAVRRIRDQFALSAALAGQRHEEGDQPSTNR
jgi:hypothetical protein